MHVHVYEVKRYMVEVDTIATEPVEARKEALKVADEVEPGDTRLYPADCRLIAIIPQQADTTS